MIRFFTAAFGESYAIFAQALASSFKKFSPDTNLHIFTDYPKRINHSFVEELTIENLLESLDKFHHSTDGQLRNAFKFALFKRMRERFPEDDICWIDADMLVFDKMENHFKLGFVNVINHGRRPGQIIECGDGLSVSGDMYAIGGMYSLPPGGGEEYLLEASRRRPFWEGISRLVKYSGDQIILNHLVARSGIPINWLTDNREFIYNLEIADSLHPVVGDKALGDLRYDGERLWRDDRKVAVFCWIKNKLDAHILDEFKTFHPDVREMLIDLYKPR